MSDLNLECGQALWARASLVGGGPGVLASGLGKHRWCGLLSRDARELAPFHRPFLVKKPEGPATCNPPHQTCLRIAELFV